MKLTEIETIDGKVSISYHDGQGYSVWHSDRSGTGQMYLISTRIEAEKWALWYTGYPEWRRDSEAAFKTAQEVWRKEHSTLESVNAVDVRP